MREKHQVYFVAYKLVYKLFLRQFREMDYFRILSGRLNEMPQELAIISLNALPLSLAMQPASRTFPSWSEMRVDLNQFSYLYIV